MESGFLNKIRKRDRRDLVIAGARKVVTVILNIWREIVDDAELLESFVALFEPLEEPIYSETVLPASQQATGIAKLEPLYSRLPAKFPDLYEKLILSYRWQRSDIHDNYCLLANPHGSDLDGLAQEIFRDENLSTDLLSNVFIRF